MIFEAKYDPEYFAYGTFRPLGTSGAAWKNMSHLPTVFAGAEIGQTGPVEVFDNDYLAGDPVGTVDAALVLESQCQL
jgi:hypothetical protein